MAGAGYRDWVAGDVPTATQFDTFLQEQTVMNFASAAARDTALSVPKSEGMVTYQRDTNTFTVYTGTAWLDIGWYSGGVLRFATAAARDTALSAVLTEGLFAYLLDTNTITVYTGAAWSTVGPTHGALTTWTPTIIQSGSVTYTNTYSRYTRVGRLITGWFQLAVTGTGSAGVAVGVNVPVLSAATTFVGGGEIFDSSASLRYNALLFMPTTGTVDFRGMSPALDNRLGVAQFTAALAAGDGVTGFFSFEAAAD